MALLPGAEREQALENQAVVVRPLRLRHPDGDTTADGGLRAERLAGWATGLEPEWFVDHDPERTR
ncbi:hypothetical protein [Streptomyces smyrnaeus]|uniref:hypothetical protein n=1 Tax=Streptomyces smyrnaeus TaxID=1387713 RepID=UPI0036809545